MDDLDGKMESAEARRQKRLAPLPGARRVRCTEARQAASLPIGAEQIQPGSRCGLLREDSVDLPSSSRRDDGSSVRRTIVHLLDFGWFRPARWSRAGSRNTHATAISGRLVALLRYRVQFKEHSTLRSSISFSLQKKSRGPRASRWDSLQITVLTESLRKRLKTIHPTPLFQHIELPAPIAEQEHPSILGW